MPGYSAVVVLFSEVDIYDNFFYTKYAPHLFKKITWLGTRRQVIFHNSAISQQAELTHRPLRDTEVFLHLYFQVDFVNLILSTSYEIGLTLFPEPD